MNLIQLAQLTETEAREHIEKIIWANGVTCPHCQTVDNATKMQGKTTRAGLYKCKNKTCRKPFTVTQGTVMEGSKVSLRNWLMAIHLLCSSRKGFSANQLQKELGLGSYETAWLLLHKIRHAMDTGSFIPKKMEGAIAADETYVGGRPRFKNSGKRGRGTPKTPVFALVETKGGRVLAQPLERVNGTNIRRIICENVSPSATIMTDEFSVYRGLDKIFAKHGVVNHKQKQYVKDGMSTNEAESFFALIKRGHHGIYHQYSKQHLPLYIAECQYRWNTRFDDADARLNKVIVLSQGKQLTYKTPKNKVKSLKTK
ncbi:MAG: IS1595 family transposase [Chloracidobacterium sp.]|nr:IS1595 family transposase [Chloracidobacterium sp.]